MIRTTWLGAAAIAAMSCQRPAPPPEEPPKAVGTGLLAVDAAPPIVAKRLPPFSYANVTVTSTKVPKRFSGPVPTSWAEVERDRERYPPLPWITTALNRGDRSMRRRFLAAVRRAAKQDPPVRYPGGWFSRLVGYMPTTHSCDFLHASLLSESEAPVRTMLASQLVRCEDARYAEVFTRKDTPDAAVVDYYFDSSRRGKLAYHPRLLIAAEAIAKTGTAFEARKASFALAGTAGPEAIDAVEQIQTAVTDPERKARLALGLYKRPEPRARALARAACEHPSMARDPVCRPRSPPPTGLDAAVRRWDASVDRLITEHGHDAVIDALTSCALAPGGKYESSECLLTLSEVSRPKAVAAARRAPVGSHSFNEVAQLLHRYPEAGQLEARLREVGLLDDEPPKRAGRMLHVTDILAAHGRLDGFDTETGAFPNEHDGLLGRLAMLAAPGLDDVIFEEIAPKGFDDQSAYELRAYTGAKRFALPAENLGDWYDVEAVIGLLNTLLQRKKSTTRYVVLKTGDQTAMVLAAPEPALVAAAAAGLIDAGGAAEPAASGKGFERDVFERLKDSSSK